MNRDLELRKLQQRLEETLETWSKQPITYEHQAWHFVHQNIGAVDAMSKVESEIDAFVRYLKTNKQSF